eukprot:gene31205-37712_t
MLVHSHHVILFCSLLVAICVRGSLLFGFKGKDAVVLSSSSKLGPNGVTLKADFKFIRPLTDSTIVGYYGDHSDIEYLHGELVRICKEEEILHGRKLSTTTLAEYCRLFITANLGQHRLKLNILVAGICSHSKSPQLYLVDEIGSMKDMPYIACGREVSFLLALLDNISREHYSRNKMGLAALDQEKDLIEVVSRCWKTLQQRSVLDYTHTQTMKIGGKGGSTLGVI